MSDRSNSSDAPILVLTVLPNGSISATGALQKRAGNDMEGLRKDYGPMAIHMAAGLLAFAMGAPESGNFSQEEINEARKSMFNWVQRNLTDVRIGDTERAAAVLDLDARRPDLHEDMAGASPQPDGPSA